MAAVFSSDLKRNHQKSESYRQKLVRYYEDLRGQMGVTKTWPLDDREKEILDILSNPDAMRENRLRDLFMQGMLVQ